MSTVISVQNLSKKYVISHQAQDRYLTLRDVMADAAKKVASKLRHPFATQQADFTQEEFWALKDINFDIQQGDKVGIIGRNGAGKSTLLKILSRITEPTTGQIAIKGRVSSLLEVGTGFHPELTGRENIYLNGAILGMSRADIKKKFDEIVAFAEVERFLDTPVKRYSSGMYVRLAFAVAAHLEPEVLIVDEVLAVGDAQFQKKCLGKMQDAGAEGRTVLFVSHNLAAIKNLCSKALLLDNGLLVFSGDANEAMDRYQGAGQVLANCQEWPEEQMLGSEFIRLKSVYLKPLQGDLLDFYSGIVVSVVFCNVIAGKNTDFTLYLYTADNICILETGIVLSTRNDTQAGFYKVEGVIPGHLLNAGIYKITLLFGDSQRYILHKFDEVMSFELEHTATHRGSNLSQSLALIDPIIKWTANYEPHLLGTV